MATLTIRFIKYQKQEYTNYTPVECVQSVRVVAKRMKSDRNKYAYYCHKNKYGITWVICNESNYGGEYWELCVDPHRHLGDFEKLPSRISGEYDYIVVSK